MGFQQANRADLLKLLNAAHTTHRRSEPYVWVAKVRRDMPPQTDEPGYPSSSDIEDYGDLYTFLDKCPGPDQSLSPAEWDWSV